MRILGVLGGMGPLATIDFLRKLVILTDAKKDKDHIHTVIDSNCNIPDRTDYLIRGGESPIEELLTSAKRLEEMGADIMVMPCNTAHYFAGSIEEKANIPLLNMIVETAKELADERLVGLLATKGTYHLKIYEEIFTRYNTEIVSPPHHLMLLVNEVIYKVKRGECSDRKSCRELLKDVIHYYKEIGIKKIILGCTELPILFNDYRIDGVEFVDPTEILALSAIKHMGKKVKEI